MGEPFGRILLPERPHHFTHGGLGSHIAAAEHIFTHQSPADLVDAEVGLFVQTLADHKHIYAALPKLLHGAHKVAADVMQPAEAERLDDKPAIAGFPDKAQNIRGGAGNQLEQKHAGVDGGAQAVGLGRPQRGIRLRAVKMNALHVKTVEKASMDVVCVLTQ